MSNDLISREAFLEKIRAYADSKAVNEGLETANNILRTVQVIEAAPAVDAEPVVHGRWVDNGIPESMLSGCSVCGFSCGAYTFNYCPNCGAKMDEEAK